jgi:membrane-bound lytic murein transglycosylase F
MEETKYNGPEMSRKKLFVLLLTAALILTLFLTRSRCTDQSETVGEDDVAVAPPEEQYLYISPFDSLFRLYADSICDWKMLAAIAYVESKFDTSARSYRGAQGLMQIMPATYRHTLAKMGVSDTMAQNVELDIRVAVRYMNDLGKLFSFINEKERINYILGSYNGGSNHIFDAMRIARKNGINRYSWSSLSPVLSSLSDPKVYNDSVCQYGFFDATETLNYVRKVTRKYNEYKSRDLMYRAFENLAENNKE